MVEAAVNVAKLSRGVIADLRNHGLTLEEICTLLGLSIGCVQQLA